MTGALPLPPDVSDGTLARSAAAGDRQAFAEIYDRYADRLYDFCVGLIGDRDAAADCVHDAFCVAATELEQLREPDKLRPWLYSIVRNHAMRRLRGRYREEISEFVPDSASDEFGPEVLAGQSELARLVADAAGGLSDRDRELLELSYRHGLDGPELAETLGVSLTNANTMVFRLRQTVERCLGALLVARGARVDANACPDLTPILRGWDGNFTVLMRKRIARHIESCVTCMEVQRRRVNPVALLGGAPVFIPAPDWLRRRTLDDVQLTSASADMTDTPSPPNGPRRLGTHVALLAGVPIFCLGATILWFAPRHTPVAPAVDTGTISRTSSAAPPPTASVVNRPPVIAPAPPPAAGVPPATTRQASMTPSVSAPGPTSQPSTPDPTSPVPTSAPKPEPQPPAAPPFPNPPAAPPLPQPPVTPPWPNTNGTGQNPQYPDPPVTPPWPNPPGTGQNPNVTPPWNPSSNGSAPFPQPPVLPPLITPIVPTLEIAPLPCLNLGAGCPKASN